MKIPDGPKMLDVLAYRFEIPLRKPLNLKGQIQHSRKGILIEREGKWAEASPLPGFSSDSLEDVIAGLRGDIPPPPSLRFATSALDQPVTGPLQVPFNGLLMGDQLEIHHSIQRAHDSNCDTVKLKVGRNDLQHDIALVREVRNSLSPNIKLRLDANQAWSLEEATTFATQTLDLEIDYVEEPLRDPTELEELYTRTGLKYALDESLVMFESIEAFPNATALVCKPTLIGGLAEIHELVATQKKVVFSAAFESGVGIVRIVQLAAAFSPKTAAGLDTLEWLEYHLLLNSPLKEQGRLKIFGEPEVDMEKLERIDL